MSIKHLDEAKDHLARALDHHSAGNHGRVKQAIKSAQLCIERALKEASSEEHDNVDNPSAAMGAQTSNGQSPRSFTPEEIRLRDQRAGIDLCYRERQRQLSGLRR